MTPSPAPPDAWTMTYSGPKALVPFDFGTVEVTFTDKGHCHVSAYSDGSRPGDIEYRGKHWYASVHLYASYDWGEGPVTGGYHHQFTSWEQDKPIAPTYRAKIVQAMSAAVRAYIETHPDVLSAAEINHLSHELGSAEKAVKDAYASWTRALARMRFVRAELSAAYRDSGTAPPPDLGLF
jgi:hypothetical protein